MHIELTQSFIIALDCSAIVIIHTIHVLVTRT